ncbi:bifunctional 4-hydroxy-2-oxoglutarate aldolase/2-dehydro-3-deoxy-phosphogluconate aldolase [Paenisporosarcina antarctica]|uniref:Bifunctional 4-hydroxy-2-oxoglutarate aldolase/2-dehydro-3-deoxy-phosphogluconate aldolase n=1 Tax=Paenisporosarcina antarctica TaxID=417367 RepID=A0A4P7A0H3_9BACL|nr:bifunctional 4-hydroxy-2-oxoglutarate aldolase/2-dehydro-3-deoxy-phosphogluconate aldolase [Paenisporosarcina antarctica]QBP42490.1 bifunctional 4-hydroxy-2-oxoglutarate aldolase/2-dehydro-3-deoxy-phosphogluconate aldolase [Paenisporosarcina antarctica]
MKKWEDLIRLKESGLIAVIRRPKKSQIHYIAEALVEGGTGALEITLDTPGALEMISELKEKFNDLVLVGAGTVLDAVSAKSAIDAGSDFIFCPSFDVETIQMTNRYGKISIPGVMTPTEIVQAYSAGADLLKIFPGGALGENYIKDLQGPLGHIPMMPTGGVNLDNVETFIKNGAVAVGAGGSLVDAKAIAEERYEVLTEISKEFIKRIQNARS